jgi:predicted MFS family arabinose efflux permease
MKASSANSTSSSLPERTLWLMALACGISVANICYNQPLLGNFAEYFHTTPAQVGWVSMATQIGYGLGLLFFLPLGDLIERRTIVLALSYACTVSLIGTALAPSLGWLVLSNLLIGLTAMSAQILIPLAVELAPAGRQGRTVGVMMTGLLGGILLARTLAGFVGEAFGWRSMYWLAAGLMIVLVSFLKKGLPFRPPVVKLKYGQLMGSLWQVFKTQPKLWRSFAVSALTFATFTAFWTTLAFLMIEQFKQGATETGLFGIVGLVGALAAPYAGKFADKRGVTLTVSLALSVTALAFGLMWVWVTIPVLIIGVLLMDVGVQTMQVAEQGKVITLLPEARSRLNTIYMVTRFIGGAAGSLIGAFAWSHGGWPAVCASSIALIGASALIHLLGTRYETVALLPALAEPAKS